MHFLIQLDVKIVLMTQWQQIILGAHKSQGTFRNKFNLHEARFRFSTAVEIQQTHHLLSMGKSRVSSLIYILYTLYVERECYRLLAKGYFTTNVSMDLCGL